MSGPSLCLRELPVPTWLGGAELEFKQQGASRVSLNPLLSPQTALRILFAPCSSGTTRLTNANHRKHVGPILASQPNGRREKQWKQEPRKSFQTFLSFVPEDVQRGPFVNSYCPTK